MLPFKERLVSLNFEEFCRRTKCKWHFRNDISETFSKIPTLEKELFTDDLDEPLPSNLSAEEWKALRKFPSNGSTLIKGTDKDSSAVFWDRTDYILEAEKHLNDKLVYKEVALNKNIFERFD